MTMDKDDKKSRKVYSKKITYLRRLIVGTVAASCLIPLCICIILAIRYDSSGANMSRAGLIWNGTGIALEQREKSLEVTI